MWYEHLREEGFVSRLASSGEKEFFSPASGSLDFCGILLDYGLKFSADIFPYAVCVIDGISGPKNYQEKS